MPLLGRILAERHGFKCTVVFPIDPATGEINPKHAKNIPGLEALASADVMVIGTRFRALARSMSVGSASPFSLTRTSPEAGSH
jgi:hypothetical protein